MSLISNAGVRSRPAAANARSEMIRVPQPGGVSAIGSPARSASVTDGARRQPVLGRRRSARSAPTPAASARPRAARRAARRTRGRARPRRPARAISTEPPLRWPTRSSTPGWRSRNSRSMPGTLTREPGGDCDCMIPSRTTPRRPPRTASTASRPASAAASAARAWGSSARPASVSRTPRARRSNSGVPSSASRRRSEAETADWTMCSRSRRAGDPALVGRGHERLELPELHRSHHLTRWEPARTCVERDGCVRNGVRP